MAIGAFTCTRPPIKIFRTGGSFVPSPVEKIRIPTIAQTTIGLKSTLLRVILGTFPDPFFFPRVSSQTELAQIYTAADVLINPTHQDNYPTVNLEARACGTPVVTYDVGGSPESAGYEYIVQEGNIQQFRDEVIRAVGEKTGSDY